MRGEDACRIHHIRRQPETPPHAWRRRSPNSSYTQATRNTPTCVGKTDGPTLYCAHLEKHPHMRGEDYSGSSVFKVKRETPPHAWGRLTDKGQVTVENGNTPTCVGKTMYLSVPKSHGKKHPHMRGEDW